MSLRNYFGLLLVALSFPFTYTNAQFRGGSSSSSVHAEDTPPYVPYVVAIYVKEKYKCVGSLVTFEYVVTTLGCVRGIDPKKIRVKAGVNSISQTGYVREVSCVHHNPVEGSDYIDIGIIKVESPFDEKPTVGTIGLCKTQLNKSKKMLVSGFYSRSGKGDDIRSTSEPIGKMGSFPRWFYNDAGIFKNIWICGYEVKIDADSGTPGVVHGGLCAVVGTLLGHPSRLYTDLSERGFALSYIKQITGCS